MSADPVKPDVTFKAPPGAGAGTAYYSGKLPSHLSQKRKRGRRSRSCSCNRGRCCFTSLCSTLITLIIIIGIVALVFWLVYHPKSPHYSVDGVRITGLDPKSLASSVISGTVNTETTFNVVANNPNQKLGFSYGDINVDIQVQGVTLGSGSLPPFYQGHRNTTIIQGDLNSGPIDINDFSQSALSGASKAGKVPLDFAVDVKARVKIGSLKSWKFKVTAHCTIFVNPTSKIPSGTTDESCSSKFSIW